MIVSKSNPDIPKIQEDAIALHYWPLAVGSDASVKGMPITAGNDCWYTQNHVF
jgi:hypothetical protein